MRIDTDPFQTAAEFDAAHAEMLELLDAEGVKSVAPQLKPFLLRGASGGGYLFDHAERRACQAILDFWATQAYSADIEIARPMLAKPNRELLPLLEESSCPYLGMKAFDECDRNRYFGREEECARLVAKVERDALVIVIGASGSGKSSLVLAGLLPKLKEKAGAGGKAWHFPPPLVPGNDPLRRLAMCLMPADASAESIDATAKAFLAEPTHLLQLLDGFAESSVLVVDQFEEVFTLQTQDNKAQLDALVENVLRVARAPDRRHRIVLTMRKDVESKLGTYPQLHELYGDAVFAVFEMAQAGLRAAIEEPAKAIGLKFQPGVVDAIVGSMVGEENNLPLLQFALVQLWKARVGNIITMEALEKLGNVKRAIPAVAEGLYEKFSEEQRKAAKCIFAKLANVGTNAMVYRNRVARGALLRLEQVNPENVEIVLRAFSAANLLRVTGAGASPSDEDLIEVVHESLLRNWRVVDEILTATVAEREQRNFLRRLADEWRGNQYDAGSLLGGMALKEVEKAFGTRGDLSDLEREFIDASTVLEKRRTRDHKLVLVGAVLSAVVLAVALLFAAWQNRAFFSRELAAKAIKIGPRDPVLGLLLAEEAYKKSKTPESLGALYALTKMAQTRPQMSLSSEQVETVDALTLTPDGLHLLTAGGGKVREWSLDAKPRLKAMLEGSAGAAYLVVSSRDGAKVAVATNLGDNSYGLDDDFAVHYWDTAGAAPASMRKLDLGGSHPVGLAFNAGGTVLAAITDTHVDEDLPSKAKGGSNSELRIWMTSAIDHPPQIEKLPGKALGLNFGSKSAELTVLLDNGQVHRVTLGGLGRIAAITAVGGKCKGADDKALFALSSDSYVRYGYPSICYNQFTKKANVESQVREESFGDAAVISSDGKSVAMLQSFSQSIVVLDLETDTTVRLPGAYDIRAPRGEGFGQHRPRQNFVQVSDTGSRVVSKRSDGSVSVYDLKRPMLWPFMRAEDTPSPDGSVYLAKDERASADPSPKADWWPVRQFPSGQEISGLQVGSASLLLRKEFSRDSRYLLARQIGMGDKELIYKVLLVDLKNGGKLSVHDARSWIQTKSDILLVGERGKLRPMTFVSTGKSRTFSRPVSSAGVDWVVDRVDTAGGTSVTVVGVANGQFTEIGKTTVSTKQAGARIDRTGKYLLIETGTKQKPVTAIWAVGADNISLKKEIEGWYRDPVAHPGGKLLVATRLDVDPSAKNSVAGMYILDLEFGRSKIEVGAVQVSPGGRYVVTAGVGSEGYQILDVATREPVFKVPGGQDAVASSDSHVREYFAFSPDDTQLAAVYPESKVMSLYSLKDRSLSAEMPFEGIRGAAFLSNAKIAVTTEFGKEVIPAQLNDWRVLAAGLIGKRTLTDEERCEFIGPGLLSSSCR